jgi:hypothetical protein
MKTEIYELEKTAKETARLRPELINDPDIDSIVNYFKAKADKEGKSVGVILGVFWTLVVEFWFFSTNYALDHSKEAPWIWVLWIFGNIVLAFIIWILRQS